MAMTLRTDDALDRALGALAEAESVSRQEVVRRAVLDRFERSRHRERVDASSTRMREQWADVLERLSHT
jgi:predicted transcriptional regulator